MPLRGRPDFDRLMFYAGFQAGVSLAASLARRAAGEAGEGARPLLEALAAILEEEAWEAARRVNREAFTTRHEEERLLRLAARRNVGRGGRSYKFNPKLHFSSSYF
ncbi:MAG: hypothetical protein DRK00_08990 [Thermoprotei archaeon]|nr:MAG: hypothetical protein DRK00_08990 [Thermoprotei archaeon]